MTDDVYRDNAAHIADELRRLDLLISLRLHTLRLQNRDFAEDQLTRTVYIGEQEVDWLLAPERDEPAADTVSGEMQAELAALSADIDGRVERSHYAKGSGWHCRRSAGSSDCPRSSCRSCSSVWHPSCVASTTGCTHTFKTTSPVNARASS